MKPPFDSPHQWCDSWCERCVLKGSCELARTDAKKRAAHLERGEDPDDPEVVLGDMLDELRHTIAALDERAAREPAGRPSRAADDPSSTDRIVVSLAVERMQRLGVRLASQTRRAARALRDDLDANMYAKRRELLFQSLVAARKCSRLTGYLDCAGRPRVDLPTWLSDAVPNVILMDEVERRLREAIEVLFEGEAKRSLEKLHKELVHLLAPLRAAVPPKARGALAALVAKGQAPSPFCVEE